MAMEGTADQGVTSLEGMEGMEMMATTAAMGTSEAVMAVVDLVLEGLVAAEARLGHHPRVAGRAMTIGMDGRAHSARREACTS